MGLAFLSTIDGGPFGLAFLSLFLSLDYFISSVQSFGGGGRAVHAAALPGIKQDEPDHRRPTHLHDEGAPAGVKAPWPNRRSRPGMCCRQPCGQGARPYAARGGGQANRPGRRRCGSPVHPGHGCLVSGVWPHAILILMICPDWVACLSGWRLGGCLIVFVPGAPCYVSLWPNGRANVSASASASAVSSSTQHLKLWGIICISHASLIITP